MPVLLPCGATIADAGDAPGDLITGPRQLEFAGLLLGSGTPYRWKELTGWDDMPGLDLADSSRPNDHGDYPGVGLYQARFPSLTLAVRGDTVDDVEACLKLLRQRAAYGDDEQPLYVRDSGGTLWAPARVISRSIPHQPQRTVGVASAGVQWKCSSPHRFSPGGHSVHLTPGVASGGLVYPLVFPLDYGTPAAGASADMPNDGEAPAPVVVTFHGPGNGYAIALDNGRLLKVNLPLVDGETLTVDTGTGTVMLNGSVDRTGWLAPESDSPDLWRIPPGGATCLYTVAEDSGPSTAVDIEWSDTNW